MRAVDSKVPYRDTDIIKKYIEWNEQCADELVSKTEAEINKNCRKWACSKHNMVHETLQNRIISRDFLNEILPSIFAAWETEQLIYQITNALQPTFDEYGIKFPAPIARADISIDSRSFVKYWFELNRTSIIAELMEEIRQECWSVVWGAISGRMLDNAILGSEFRYSLQQKELKVLLMKQIDSALMYVEQKISGRILQEVIPEIYRQFDQREGLLKQSLYTLPPTDRLAEEIFHQISG